MKNLFLNNNLWTPKENEGLDLDIMAIGFANVFLESIVSLADIAAYLKEAKGPRDAIGHVRQL